MSTYIAYGLRIHSELPLPELPASAEASSDVRIRRAVVEGLSPSSRSEGTFLYSPEQCCLSWNGVGTFVVREGTEVFVEPHPEVDLPTLRLFLLGPVISVVLHQRGYLALHSSAVAVNGGVAIFIGEKGWGKSTTAAALHRRGHALVVDDVAGIDVRPEGEIRVLPGFPQLKLWPEAASSSLGDNPESLPRLYADTEKRARRVTEGFCNASLPLQRVYVLAEGPEPAIERLPTQQALIELIRHTHVANLLGATGTGSTHLQQCARIVNTVPVCRLSRPRNLEILPELVRLVEQDLDPSGKL